jgi:diguanylate cyclase (GGDEF)-like protein
MWLRKHGITEKMILLTVIPLLLLSALMSFGIGTVCYRSVYDEVYQELESVCVGIYEFASADGFFASDNEAVFDGISSRTGIDITVFEGSTRKITTVKNSEGARIVGTQAADEVVSAVIDSGSDFFSDNVEVNGVRYFGYYMPLTNVGGTVTGMTFAGKSRENVDSMIFESTMKMLVISWLAAFLVLIACIAFSGGMVRALHAAADFLKRISQGDTECEPDTRLTKRLDEIGDIGRSAVMLQKSLRDLISNDPLTGLYNRRACNIKLSEMKTNADEFNSGLTVALGDIDFFKHFNDSYGHACGDVVLKDIAGILSEGVKGKGIVSRWGGEEFLLVFGGISHEEALAAMDDIMENIRAYRCHYNGEEIPVTMTFGIEEYDRASSIDSLVNAADKKLYAGKNGGRNRIVSEVPE